MSNPYQSSTRDDPADCDNCGCPLAGDNNKGICFQCQRESAPVASVTAPDLDIVGYKGMAYRLGKYDHASPIFCANCEEHLTFDEAKGSSLCIPCRLHQLRKDVAPSAPTSAPAPNDLPCGCGSVGVWNSDISEWVCPDCPNYHLWDAQEPRPE